MKHNSRRVTAVVTLLLLSGITGVVSYEHGLDVVRWVGNTGLVSYLIPFVPDLMIVSGSMTALEASAMGKDRPRSAVASIVMGIGWTIAANVVAGTYGGVGGALIAAGIPIAFIIVLEALLWLVRNTRVELAEDKATEATTAATASVSPVAVKVAELKAKQPELTQKQIAKELKVSTRTVQRHLRQVAA